MVEYIQCYNYNYNIIIILFKFRLEHTMFSIHFNVNITIRFIRKLLVAIIRTNCYTILPEVCFNAFRFKFSEYKNNLQQQQQGNFIAIFNAECWNLTISFYIFPLNNKRKQMIVGFCSYILLTPWGYYNTIGLLKVS